MRSLLVFTYALALLGLVQGAAAREAPDSKATEWMVAKIGQHVGSTDDPDRIREMMLRLFKSADIDGGGVTDTDYLLQRQLSAARLRAGMILRTAVLDIDGDGAVSRAEVELSMRARAREPVAVDGIKLELTPEQVQQRLDKLAGDALRLDGDGDGIVSFAEMVADATKRQPPPTDAAADRQRGIPAILDENGDGAVGLEEFKAIVDRAMDYIDIDGDGKLSPSERSAITEQIREYARKAAEEERARRQAQQLAERERRRTQGCGFPKPSASARVVLLAVYEGLALSTAGIGGDGEVVEVIDVAIEPGERPLYVVAVSYESIVWRFSGAVDRVERVVADSIQRVGKDKPRAGVAGLSAGRVHFPAMGGCAPYYDSHPESDKYVARIQILEQLVGRPVDPIFNRYGIGSVSLPGGVVAKDYVYPDRVEPPSGTPGEPMWKMMLRFSPGGLVRVDPGAVVSRLPVAPYKVLPQQAGLAQLLDEGALKARGQTQMLEIGEMRKAQEQKGYTPKPIILPEAFVIQRKIAFPAGLAGAHSVTFILPSGVPQPDGSPDHSRVIQEPAGAE